MSGAAGVENVGGGIESESGVVGDDSMWEEKAAEAGRLQEEEQSDMCTPVNKIRHLRPVKTDGPDSPGLPYTTSSPILNTTPSPPSLPRVHSDLSSSVSSLNTLSCSPQLPFAFTPAASHSVGASLMKHVRFVLCSVCLLYSLLRCLCVT